MTIRKLLIANRGEIACRIIRTAKNLGIATVAVHSDADADAMHVTLADEALRIGKAPVAESYLLGDVIIEAAKRNDADAIHPGYGFLSENPDFVEAVETAGLTFIGPSASSIRAMGLKDRAKALMEAAGVPVVPGYHGDERDPDFLAKRAAEIGYPVLIKARAGGGGKGMRLVERASDFLDALASAEREGEASFGDPTCLIEKYIERPRHIEIQVFGDQQGHVVHLFERDCSLQRRHQKVIEEAPGPGMSEAMRAAMGAAAVKAAKAVDYVGAGTVEFIVDGSTYPDVGGFWFMEMNTRLQVEHPVTELITGLDLVRLQIKVAEGEPLPFSQDELSIDGHAFEARLYAEDVAAGFLPSTGRLDHLAFPSETEGLRIDTGVQEGDQITPYYDPMIAKIIAHGVDRQSALRKLERCLAETLLSGSVTNRAFLHRLVGDEDVRNGDVDTGLIGRKRDQLAIEPLPEALDYAFAALACLLPAMKTDDQPSIAWPNFRLFGQARQSVTFDEDGPISVVIETSRDRTCHIETPLGSIDLADPCYEGDQIICQIDGQRQKAFVIQTKSGVLIQRRGQSQKFERFLPGALGDDAGMDAMIAPMPGRVVEINVQPGEKVEKGDRLIVLEAMKMEHALTATRDGVVAEVLAREGDQVEQGGLLLSLEDEDQA